MRELFFLICLWMMFCITDTAFAIQKHQSPKHAKIYVTKPDLQTIEKKQAKANTSQFKGDKRKRLSAKGHQSKLSKTKFAKTKLGKRKTRLARSKRRTTLASSKGNQTKSQSVPAAAGIHSAKTKLAKARPTKAHKSQLNQTETLPKLALATEKLVTTLNEQEKISDTTNILLQPLKINTPPIKKVRTASPKPVGRVSTLQRELNEAIEKEGSYADVGVYIKSMKNGDALYTRNINLPMTPASTLKVLTAEAALIYLGTEYRFSTQLLTDAKQIKDGVLQGNIYIVLGGDPTLTFNDLMDLLFSLSNEQIRAISGNVYIDNTAYDQNFYGPDWAWEDKDFCYAAPISASIINRNCIFFKIASSSSGRLAQIVTSSRYFYPSIKNSVITKSYGYRSCSVRLSAESPNRIDVNGCILAGHALGVSFVVSDVPEYTRLLFRSLLNRFGIRIYGSITFAQAPETLFLLGSHASKPLRLLIIDMLKKSDNIIAGAIFKKLGQLYTHKPGSWERGGYAVTQILSRHAGMKPNGSRILDGSGLSPSNLATPAQMMQVLNFAYHHAETSEDFITALPIGGVDGTLKHRMNNIPRKVRAKTGTISGVVSLAGYAESADKEPLAFVIMINGNKGLSWQYKSMEDKIALILTRYKRR